ncbi:hypothetical protein [Pseudotamlana agarivorans]|uniref:hypothetical protein n=1 Tax=Pseudotamlana agarivorans TaxID=481183 RepID=UPI000829FD22|nr:hypothetical protein [Tamlana agarivorans]
MKQYLFYLKLSVFFVFFGRAYQFFFFGAPFRALLWDESLLTPIVEGFFNMSWQDYATSAAVNNSIESFTKFGAFIFLLGALLSLFWERIKFEVLKRTIIILGTLLLVIIGICLTKEKSYDPLQFFELSIQIAAPIALLFSGDLEASNKKSTLLWLKIAIALTFIPHGLFAMGLIYVPGHFIDLTISILKVTETQAKYFLFTVGFLDVVASVLIFLPKLSKYAFMYIIVWGFLTAFARVIVGVNSHFFLSTLHNSAFLTIYRIPHGLLPLATFTLFKITNNHQNIIK